MRDQAETLRRMVEGGSPVRETGPSRVITVTSGKGGVGKTVFTINLAILLQQMGMRVLVIDADLGLANVDLLMGIVPPYSLRDAIFGERSLREVIVESHCGVQILPGATGLYELADMDGQRLRRFLLEMRELADLADLLLIDTGAGISRTVLGFVLCAREVVLLTTPEPTAITDAYSVVKAALSRGSEAEIGVVVNMVSDEEEAERSFARLSRTVERFLGHRITHLGQIPRDVSVERGSLVQRPFVLDRPRSRASLSLARVAEAISLPNGSEPSPERGSSLGFFREFVSGLLGGDGGVG